MKLALFILNGGHELIGKIIEETATSITLSEPQVLRPVQTAVNQYKLDFFPHSLANPDGEHTFYFTQFVSRALDIPVPLENAYIERTTSVILTNALDAFAKL